MIPAIATMLAVYIVVRLCSVAVGKEEESWVRSLAGTGILITLACVVWVWIQAVRLDQVLPR